MTKIASKKVIEQTKQKAILEFNNKYGNESYNVITLNMGVKVSAKMHQALTDEKVVFVYYGNNMTLP